MIILTGVMACIFIPKISSTSLSVLDVPNAALLNTLTLADCLSVELSAHRNALLRKQEKKKE